MIFRMSENRNSSRYLVSFDYHLIRLWHEAGQKNAPKMKLHVEGVLRKLIYYSLSPSYI